MKRLVIAIDCDDVLVPGTEHTVSLYNRIWNTRVPLVQAHNPHAAEWLTTRDETHRRIDDIYLSEEYGEAKPYQEAIEAIGRLSKQHELHMVTARPEKIMSVTERMVDTYFLGHFTSVRHVGFYGSKGDICKALQADVLIDDNLKHLLSAKDCGVNALIWFGDYPWQTEQLERGTVTARCLDWPSVEVEIEKLATV